MNPIYESYLRGVFEREKERKTKMRNAGRVVLICALVAIGIVPAIAAIIYHLWKP
jgi:hypothetical protein